MEQLFDRMRELHAVMTAAGVAYRIVGGLAVYLHVSERDPFRARLTADIDAAIDRSHLPAVVDAAKKAGWVYRRAAGVDMLIDGAEPKARSAVHLIFLNEKVRSHYPEPVPASTPDKSPDGVLLAPVADLVRMKLTSYRLKDRVHIQDLDGVGLITPAMEKGLPELLRNRLAEIRSTE